MLYHAQGEGWTEREAGRRKAQEKKAAQAKEAAELLAKRVQRVRESVAKRHEEKQKEKAAAAARGSNNDDSSGNKRAASADAQAPPGKKSKASKGFGTLLKGKDPAKNPKACVGSRIAKFFQDNDLYFGTIETYIPSSQTDDKVDLWNVVYDDGDVEDFELDEVQQGLVLYMEYEDKDPTLKK